MKIEFDFKRAGLVKANTLSIGQCFVNGGIMSQPNVFLVIDAWHPPGKAYGNASARALAEEDTLRERMRRKSLREAHDEYIQVFNLTQGHVQNFGADKMVAVLNVVLKVQGYADPRAEQALGVEEPHSQFIKNEAPEPKSNTEYDVRWIIEVDADSPLQAAQRAQEMIRDPDTTATVFNVTDQMGRVTSLDLGKQAPAGQGG